MLAEETVNRGVVRTFVDETAVARDDVGHGEVAVGQPLAREYVESAERPLRRRKEGERAAARGRARLHVHRDNNHDG